MPLIFSEHAVFYREKAAKFYHPFAYAAALMLVEIPYNLVASFSFTIIFFNLVGFVSVDTPGYTATFCTYWMIYFLHLSMATYYGQFLAAWTPSVQVAQVLMAMINCVWQIMCGFLIPYPLMLPGLRWLYFACPLGWTIRNLAVGVYSCEVRTIIRIYFDKYRSDECRGLVKTTAVCTKFATLSNKPPFTH